MSLGIGKKREQELEQLLIKKAEVYKKQKRKAEAKIFQDAARAITEKDYLELMLHLTLVKQLLSIEDKKRKILRSGV